MAGHPVVTLGTLIFLYVLTDIMDQPIPRLLAPNETAIYRYRADGDVSVDVDDDQEEIFSPFLFDMMQKLIRRVFKKPPKPTPEYPFRWIRMRPPAAFNDEGFHTVKVKDCGGKWELLGVEFKNTTDHWKARETDRSMKRDLVQIGENGTNPMIRFHFFVPSGIYEHINFHIYVQDDSRNVSKILFSKAINKTRCKNHLSYECEIDTSEVNSIQMKLPTKWPGVIKDQPVQVQWQFTAKGYRRLLCFTHDAIFFTEEDAGYYRKAEADMDLNDWTDEEREFIAAAGKANKN